MKDGRKVGKKERHKGGRKEGYISRKMKVKEDDERMEVPVSMERWQ